MALLFALDGVQALIFNFRNDQRLKREGQPPVDPLGYALLNFRYLIRIVMSLVLAMIVVNPIGNKWFTLVLMFGLVILLTSIIETCVRVLLVKAKTRKLKEAGVEPEEKETK